MGTQSDDSGSRYADPGMLIDGDEDRFAWRAKIKRNPVTRRIYRIFVGISGVLLIILAAVTGWLPGPGGIPLALLGLAILASEFEWADRLLLRLKKWGSRAARWIRGKPRWYRHLLVAAAIASVLTFIYGYLALTEVPSWLPEFAKSALAQIPGLGK